MNSIIKKVKNIHAEACVSIIMNTHRTHPDNEQDPILLGNLVKEAKERLHNDYEKRFVWPIEEKLDQLVAEIDHNYNLDSLVIFVNEEFAEYTRLSTSVTDRVVIDNTFATRDIIRSSHEEGAYYILQLSNEQARLIEAYTDRVQQEFEGEFPLKNNLRAKNAEEATHSRGSDNITSEFFNQVDKAYQEAIKGNPLPLIVVTESRNFDDYVRVADHKELLIGHINRLPDGESAAKIVATAWPEVQERIQEKNAARIEELKIAESQNLFLTGYKEIWTAINEGRGKTLFVKKGHYQPAIIEEDNTLTLVEEDQTTTKGVVDDIIDEMIELNMSMGGDVVFVKNDDLEDYQNISLVTRY